MKIEIKESNEMNIAFKIFSPVSFANSIRRILLSEVPSVAIDLIEIKENKTVLADEMLSNRLGLVPLHCSTPLVPKTECSCDSYCSQCSIQFMLKKMNMGKDVISVTGKDLVTTSNGVAVHNSLIVKLAPGQLVDIKCIARSGIPLSHVKYCPVTAVAFNYDSRNTMRDTNLWYEDDVKKEWPSINQSEEVQWGECKEVDMDVEVVEGCGMPKDILLKALEIYKEKLVKILESIQ